VRLGSLASEPDTFADGPFGSHLKTAHYSSSGARVIRLQNVGRGVFLDHDRAFISLEHFTGLTRHSVVAGDIIVAALGDGARPAGRACMVPDGLAPALVKADCFRVRLPEDIVHPPYLTAYLNSAESLGRIRGMMRGATRPRVTLGMLRALMMPMPPVGEQRRISARLAGWLTEIDWAHAVAEAQLEAAKALSAACLRTVFASAEAQRWPRRELGDVSEIVSGITLGRPLTGSRTQRIPYLRVANVKDGYLDMSDVYQIEVSEAERESLRLRSGDLLLTEGGDPDKLGRGTVWRDELPECVHQNHIFRVRFDLAQFAPDFVSARRQASWKLR
jgi:type I restriction enzyme S subunit